VFDAKSLIEMMMKGAAGQAPKASQQSGGGLGGLGDLLGQVLAGAGGAGGARTGAGGAAGGIGDILGQFGRAAQSGAAQPQAQASDGGLGGLGDLLKQLGGSGQRPAAGQTQAPPADSGGLGGGLEDMLRKLQGQLGGAASGGAASGGTTGGAGGGLMDILGQVLGQATGGVKEGAQRMDQATGASDRMRQATGQSPADLLERLKELVRQNQIGAGAAAGGLGAVVLGTKTGRNLAMKAAKIGGLALIGGLAYKALQNYQAGRPLLDGSNQGVAPAPAGTGYEPQAVTQESALLYVRGMIAAAAADGRIDAAEQQKILGNLQQVGINAEAEEFLANELNNPASVADLAAAVRSQEEAVQLFTAARLAVDLDTDAEHDFLVALAQAVGLEGELAQHIDAAARAA
jgi:uncharacterized membrane protein YebE (DUF533 family)